MKIVKMISRYCCKEQDSEFFSVDDDDLDRLITLANNGEIELSEGYAGDVFWTKVCIEKPAAIAAPLDGGADLVIVCVMC